MRRRSLCRNSRIRVWTIQSVAVSFGVEGGKRGGGKGRTATQLLLLVDWLQRMRQVFISAWHHCAGRVGQLAVCEREKCLLLVARATELGSKVCADTNEVMVAHARRLLDQEEENILTIFLGICPKFFLSL